MSAHVWGVARRRKSKGACVRAHTQLAPACAHARTCLPLSVRAAEHDTQIDTGTHRERERENTH